MRFNKSKDVLINTNKIISDYIKKFLFDFFSISDLSNAFYNINFYTNNSRNATDVQYFNQSLQTVTITEKKKKFFIINQKNLDIIVKFKKKVIVKKMWFFLAMVRLRYSPADNDLSLKVERLLRRVWNINSHCDKRENVECIIYEEWAIDVLKNIWEDDFVDFETAIRKVRENDETFINFNEISIHDADSVYNILISK